MTKKLGRGTAGARVLARVTRFDNALLAEEEEFALQASEAFTDGAASAARVLASSLRRVRGKVDRLKNDGDLQPRLVAEHQAVLTSLRSNAELLVRSKTVPMTMDSLGDELLLCERTLADRYKGVAASGVASASQVQEDVVRGGLVAYDAAIARVQVGFENDLQSQMNLAIGRLESEDDLAARLLSMEPLRMHGNGGRGVWFRSPSAVGQCGRALVTAVANTLRETAIDQMNANYARVHG